MYRLFLVTTLLLRLGVLGTETVKLHENDEVLVAVPNADVPPQEPIVRVVARDLDKVKVVPYASNEGVSRRNGGSEERGVPKDEHSSSEAVTARSHQRQHRSHDRLKKRRRASHRGAEYEEADMFGLDQNPLYGLPRAVPGFSAYLGQGDNNNPECNVKPVPPRRRCTPQSHMNMCACREALKRERYCMAALRRARLCKDQYSIGHRHGGWDFTGWPRGHHHSHRKHGYYDPAGRRRDHRYSSNKSKNKTRAHHDPVDRKNVRHHSKNKRARHQSRGKGRANHDPVSRTHDRRHPRNKRAHNRSNVKHSQR